VAYWVQNISFLSIMTLYPSI